MAADGMSGGSKVHSAGRVTASLGAGGSRKKSRRRDLHPPPSFHNSLCQLLLRNATEGLAGNGPGGRGTPRARLKLAPPDAFRQSGNHDPGAVFPVLADVSCCKPVSCDQRQLEFPPSDN